MTDSAEDHIVAAFAGLRSDDTARTMAREFLIKYADELAEVIMARCDGSLIDDIREQDALRIRRYARRAGCRNGTCPAVRDRPCPGAIVQGPGKCRGTEIRP